MNGEDPISAAGWGRPAERAIISERDPALGGAPRRSEARLPLGALLIAFAGILAGVVGSLAAPGDARFDLTIAEGLARSGFAIATLAGLWIALGGRGWAPGARWVGLAVIGFALLLAVATA